MRIRAITFLILAMAFLTSAQETPAAKTNSSRLKIVTSFLPIYCFASNVAGDFADVANMLPAGNDPHDYQFTPHDLDKLSKADLIFMNGLGVDEWLDGAIASNAKKQANQIVKISDGLKTELIQQRSEKKTVNSINPHIWLDPQLAIHAVTNILSALQKADPKHATEFAANANVYVLRLQKLDTDIAAKLAGAKKEGFLTYHDAFPYFIRRYDLKLVGVVELIPDIEPTPRYLERLLKTARSGKAKALLSEPPAPSRLARQIAGDLKIQLEELDPLETSPELKPTSYEDGMRKNADVLQKLLQ